MVKDTCKQERKTQLQQVGTLQSSAERHNNREADSGRSSTCVAGAGAKQQAAGARAARGDLPAGQRRATPPAGTPTQAPSRETGSPACAWQGASCGDLGPHGGPGPARPRGSSPPLHGATTHQALWPLALAQCQPPSLPGTRGLCQVGHDYMTTVPVMAPALLKVQGTPSQPEGLTQADSRVSALPTPPAHLHLMKRNEVAGAKWTQRDRWAQPLAP